MAERAVTLMKQQQQQLRPDTLEERPDPAICLDMHKQLLKRQSQLLQQYDSAHWNFRLKKLEQFSNDSLLVKEHPSIHRVVQNAISKMQSNQNTGLMRYEQSRERQVRKRVYELLSIRFNKRAKVERKDLNEDELDDEHYNDTLDEHSRQYRQMVRRVIPKAAKQMSSSFLARTGNAKKAATLCAREAKKIESRELKALKEATLRSKRLMREQLAFWKKNEREERELKKKADKEAAERKKLEEEQREARRQAKKLNFLITQTELYSHFIARKSSNSLPSSSSNSKGINANIDFADVDDEVIKREAERKAAEAAHLHHKRLSAFDNESDKKRRENDASLIDSLNFQNPTLLEGQHEIQQPELLKCQLKGYQLKGLTWLANLYEQGINGILADEMGLGKTVQSISLMAHLAERHAIWGPFLVIAPASTLHNWQQEICRFIPAFRILPYWGSVKDRLTLRKFWNPKHLYARDSPFHVLITSYQLIVSDEKYFQRIKWQYMILDEAQAIKSSSSIRWKTLLSFDCRNRLLLTGTPIQNSMQELWALLHFIMPGLFDSHDEFNDWFSKDIEAAATQSSSSSKGFNEHQLQRLHMILKPFMLRRVKKDVESELGDKIEIDLVCEMSNRQKRMYQGIKEKVPIAELLEMSRLDQFSAATSNLMNLVMQFRKVCNHPDLFERTELSSPWMMHDLGRIGPEHPKDDWAIWMGPLGNPVKSDCKILELEEPDSRLFFVNQRHSIPCIQVDENVNQAMMMMTIKASPIFSRLENAYSLPVLAKPIIEGGVEAKVMEDIGASVRVPSIKKMILSAGKLQKLDELLKELKAGGHRVLIYNQMTRMIDLMEEYLQYRHYTYLRLDGSSRIADRRDLVSDWQTRPDIFVFLLSTRAGGLGINLTAADTVIFYDSDWNPTVDQQAMDRAHRLGQTKQVTVYRLITKGSIEERILQRAQQKDAIHKMVIAGGEFKTSSTPSTSLASESLGGKPPKDRELAMLLLDDNE